LAINFARRAIGSLSRLFKAPAAPASSASRHFDFMGFSIPEDLALLTGGGGDTFEAIADEHLGLIEKLVGIQREDRIVEIGCGIGRDAIPLTRLLSERGSYLGIDVIKDQIDWNKRNITARFPNFAFDHFDIREKWYNPRGTKSLEDCRIDRPDGSVDTIILQSVFTHMLPRDVTLYLKEFSRILKPSGRVFVSVFLIDDDVLAGFGPTSYITIAHLVESGCYVHDIEQPTHAVGYRIGKLEELMGHAGLRLAREPLPGSWSGRPKTAGGQDTLILAKATPA
jgi:SAM-dependent methyltransferase